MTNDEVTRDAIRVLMGWLANRLEGGERLQRPDVGVQGAIPLVFYTDAKAEDGRAWIGGFLARDIAGLPGALVLARSGEGLGTLGFFQGEALGPRRTDKADHPGS